MLDERLPPAAPAVTPLSSTATELENVLDALNTETRYVPDVGSSLHATLPGAVARNDAPTARARCVATWSVCFAVAVPATVTTSTFTCCVAWQGTVAGTVTVSCVGV